MGNKFNSMIKNIFTNKLYCPVCQHEITGQDKWKFDNYDYCNCPNCKNKVENALYR